MIEKIINHDNKVIKYFAITSIVCFIILGILLLVQQTSESDMYNTAETIAYDSLLDLIPDTIEAWQFEYQLVSKSMEVVQSKEVLETIYRSILKINDVTLVYTAHGHEYEIVVRMEKVSENNDIYWTGKVISKKEI